MAYTNFYVQTTGNNLNSGSTTADAASLTYAGGTYVRATNIFTAASGDPLSDGVLVGDIVSVYTTSGATTATFLMQVTARDATTITGSTTVIWGVDTTVSETALAATLKVGGAHASELPWATMTGTVPAATKVHIKAGTYTVTAARTFAMAGATTTPLWFSGYNTTIGDCDAEVIPSLTKPLFSINSTFYMSPTGTHQIWSSLTITGTRSDAVWSTGGTLGRYSRLNVENLSTNASSFAAAFSGIGTVVQHCYFKATTSGTSFGVAQVSGSITLIGCVAEGGGLAGYVTGANAVACIRCVALNNVIGFSASTGDLRLHGCTVKNSSGDGVKWSGTPSGVSQIAGCTFQTCGGYGINNASGTATNVVFRAANVFTAITSGNENGFTDSPAFLDRSSSMGAGVNAEWTAILAAAGGGGTAIMAGVGIGSVVTS